MHRLALGFVAMVSLAPLAQANAISEDDLRPHIEMLASDAFEGREPGTEGERKTTAYISQQWKNAGLKPAASDGSWLEPVQLVRRGQGAAEYQFHARGTKLRFVGDEIVLIGKEANYARSALPLWFAGFGVGADGKVAGDVTGKAVLMLAERPAFVADDMKSVRARREALVAAGADAVLIVGGEQGEYPLIRRQMLSRSINMVSREKRAALEGVVGATFAVALVTAAGGDWDKLRTSASNADFAGAALGITADFNITTDVNAFASYNVIGKLPGKKKNSGAVLYMGHWDHLGICRPEGDEDRICNGAIDNASGIAVMTEVGRKLAKKRHDRDIYFVATTAEESGLLGAYAFTEKPVLPLDKIVVALNIDTIAVAPRGEKVTIIGRGTTAFDPVIDRIAKKAGRLMDETTEANSFIRRQDGWALSQKGVPALMIGGAFADLVRLQLFLDADYHGPDDELTETTELGGAAEDATLHVALGKHFASTRKQPVAKPVEKTEIKTGE